MQVDSLSYYLYRLVGALAPHISPPSGYALAEHFGSILYRLSPLRHNVEDNVSHVLGAPVGSPEVRKVARQIFRNQSKNYFDLLRVSRLTPDDIRRSVTEMAGTEHLDAALARGHGVVVAGAHVGNVDVAAQVLALRGYKVMGLAEHLKPERLFQYLRRARESHGLTFIPIDCSLRPAFRALRANEIVGTALDRNVTDGGRLVPFFGQPARLPDGYLKLVLHTGAALVVAFGCRLPGETFAVRVYPEVQLERTGDLEHDVAANMPRVLPFFEAYLKRYPEQWVLFQPVWVAPLPVPAGDASAPATLTVLGRR